MLPVLCLTIWWAPYAFTLVTLSSWPALFALIRHSIKRGYAFTQSHITYPHRCLLSLFKQKYFLEIQFFELMLLLLILLFFKLGILLHLSLPLIPTFLLLNED